MLMKGRFAPLCVALILGLIALPRAATATYYAVASADAGGPGQANQGFYSAVAQDSSSGGDGFSNGSGSASALVFLGLLHMTASGAGSGYGGGGGSASGSFTDELTFNSASMNGQAGYFYETFYVRGSLSASGSGDYGGDGSGSFFANLLADLPAASFSSSSPASGLYSLSAGTASYSGDSLPVLLTLEVPFVFGQSFTVGFYMSVSAGGSGNGSGPPNGGMGVADFSDTAYWGGVTQVFASDNSLVTDFSLTSEFRHRLYEIVRRCRRGGAFAGRAPALRLRPRRARPTRLAAPAFGDAKRATWVRSGRKR